MNLLVYWKETKYEFLKLLRMRRYALSVIAFPVMFYIFFGLAMPSSPDMHVSMATYLLATYGTFGVMGACLFGVGANLANERGLGWLELKQVSPLPPGAYFFAKLAASIFFGTTIVGLMLVLGLSFGHVRLAPVHVLQLLGVLIAGAIPFGSLGIALGYITTASSAPAFLNLIYLPMAFCSGLWVPIQYLPSFLQKAAPFLPPYHLSALALGVLGVGQPAATGQHWQALAAFTVIFLAWAFILYGREQSRKNGMR